MQGFIFDFDGIIVDTEPFAIQAWKSCLRPYGVDLSNDQFNLMVGTSNDLCVNLIKDQTGVEISEIDFWNTLLDLIKINISAPKDGLLPLLIKIQKRGNQLAIASNSITSFIISTLKHLQIDEHFSEIVGSDQVVNHKPFPDVYLEAARRLGVSPQNCLAFEDTPLGAQAAISAGMKCILIPNLLLPPPPNHFQVYQNFYEVLANFDDIAT
ncbi:MAG: HAD family phosphatase [Anaerolineaceae bacterium]|nr:HAD family phosphatase [Anaerolineaceae bacterium]